MEAHDVVQNALAQIPELADAVDLRMRIIDVFTKYVEEAIEEHKKNYRDTLQELRYDTEDLVGKAQDVVFTITDKLNEI